MKTSQTVSTVPSVVSKRNHFDSAEEMVDDAMQNLPPAYQSPHFRAWLLRYTEGIVRRVSCAFATAAERGIEQAQNLICDPEFYVAKRERRARELARMKQQVAAQHQDRLEMQHCPTAEQIAKQIEWVERDLERARAAVPKLEAALERLRGIQPKNIRMMIPKDRT